MEAIISATHYPAELFRMQSTLGTIEKGKIADLVLLDANPLDDIRNTKRIQAVMVNGRYFREDSIQKMLADVEAAATLTRMKNEPSTQNYGDQHGPGIGKR